MKTSILISLLLAPFILSCGKNKSSSSRSTPALINCPENYVRIPRNPDLDTTKDFCVAKFEMKQVDGKAVSQRELAPWVSVTVGQVIDACAAIGDGYALLTNPQWMTIARNIERQDANWSSGIAGTGFLSRGHSDNNPGYGLAAGPDDTDPYYLTGNDSTQAPDTGWEQRRIHTLSTGDKIWDIAGNVREALNWPLPEGTRAYVSSDGGSVQGWRDFLDLDSNVGEGDVMALKTFKPYFEIPGTSGLGRYYGNLDFTGLSYGIRGGAFFSSNNTGVYTLDAAGRLNSGVTVRGGFRCAFNP